MLEQLQLFIQQQISFLIENRINPSPELMDKLILSNLNLMKINLSTEELLNLKNQFLEKVPMLTEVTTKNSYTPSFIVKEKRSINASEQIVNKAKQTLESIRQPLFDEYIDINVISNMTRPQISVYIKPIIAQCLNKRKLYLNSIEQQVLETLLLDDMVGFGPLESLLADSSVTDILVNGPNKVYVERHGQLEKTSTVFKNENHILHIIHQILTRSGRRIDISHPYVNVKLDDGTRINAVIPPVAIDSPSLSIRKFSEKPINLGNMVLQENLSIDMMLFLMIAVQSRLNIIVSGGTGAGKTTLLNALAQTIKDNERIVTIEDVAELKLGKEHVVRLETRNMSLEGSGSVTERELLINALRMRPDRIILGEVRGKEAFDMLQAMNTGHDGSMSTIHANGTEEVPLRLCDMLAMANLGLTTQSSLKQINSAVDIIVQTSRLLDGKRRVIQISEVIDCVNDEVKLQHLFEFDYSFNSDNKVVGHFVKHRVTPKCLKKTQNFGLNHLVEKLFKDYDAQ